MYVDMEEVKHIITIQRWVTVRGTAELNNERVVPAVLQFPVQVERRYRKVLGLEKHVKSGRNMTELSCVAST